MSDAPENRLARETSPYLLQHARNPVDWYPWGEEALTRAREEDRPIFLSIGYSACHWCHVMERESFEDPCIARLMNELFVNVKVDREERPDIDEIYMTAVQVMTGHGGWPLSMFLTPDLRPFYGGTYFPPKDRWGRPGFPTVLRRVADLYAKDRDRVVASAGELTEIVDRHAGLPPGGGDAPGRDLFVAGLERRAQAYDPLHGGFGGAPKFPPHFALECLERAARAGDGPRFGEMLLATLERMARGGMVDQLGGGFARYSTDERWLVPHFEKMLYDNALLVPRYLEAARWAGREDLAEVARETLDWMLREMVDPETGGIYSAQDADSEGVEGKFFVWTPAEVDAALDDPELARVAKAWFDVTDRGNWHEMPGVTVLARPAEAAALAEVLGMEEAEVRELAGRARARLFEARARRVPPATDTKVLTAWNGLAIRALAAGARHLGDARYLEAARRAAGFCLGTLRGPAGLLRTYGAGKAHLAGYLEDYSYLIRGLLALFEVDQDLAWLEAARELADEMLARFWDEDGGAFFFTSHDHETLIARTKNPMDNATPSGNSEAARALLRLAHLTGDARYREKAEATLAAFRGALTRLPEGYMNMLVAVDEAATPPAEVVVAGPADAPATRELLAAAHAHAAPDTLVLLVDPDAPDAARRAELVPHVAGKTPDGATPRAYVCTGGTCRRPVTTPADLRAELPSPRA